MSNESLSLGIEKICRRCGKKISKKRRQLYYHPVCGWKVWMEKNRARGRGQPYYYWKKEVFKLNSVCAYCGAEGKLEADHIRPWGLYPELRLEVSNGQTLCETCHKLKSRLDRIESKWIKNLVLTPCIREKETI